MTPLLRPLRLLALLLTALLLASRSTATWEDARRARASARAAAEGVLVHVEDGRSADCTRVHPADCEFCRVVAASEDRPVRPAVALGVAAEGAAPASATGALPAALPAGPRSARPPPA